MPRLPRLHVPGGFYHVMMRGNHREELFASVADRFQFNTIVAEVIERFDARIHAFCWMTNHIHLLIQIADRPLGKIMQCIASRYSRYRQKQLRTSGHLFERRYKAKLVDADSYLSTLLRYIHLHPVEANIVADPADYPWSSHHAYLGHETLPWLTIDFGLSLFGHHVDQARSAYMQFISQALYASDSRVLEKTHPDDPRVLGGDRFLAQLPPLKLTPKSPLTLFELASQVCHARNVDLDVVRSASRKRALTVVRISITQQALSGRIANIREVAVFLNRDPSSLSSLLLRHERVRSP